MDDFLKIAYQLIFYLQVLLEVGILTVIFYSTLYFLRRTRALSILAGIATILIIMIIASDILNLEVINWLLSSLWPILAGAIIVIFQPEIRRFFAQVGSSTFSYRKIRKKEAINEVVNSVLNMSKQRVGATIIFERQIGMASIVNNAIQLDMKLNTLLIESIFFPNAPLHDGAIIIKNDRIIAAHAILPLSQDENLIKTLGTRHRAGIGITEETDAVAIIVSEETGYISVACNGRLKHNIKHDRLLRFLSGLLISTDNDSLKNLFSLVDNDDINEGFAGGENSNE